MATQEEIILKVELDNQQANKNIEKTTKQITELKTETKELTKQNKELEKQGKQNSKQFQDNEKQIALNRAQVTKLNTERRNAIKIVQSEVNSLAQQRAKLAELTAAYVNQEQATEEGKKRFEELGEEVKKLNEEILEAEKNAGNYTRQVGKYDEANKGASKGFGSLSEGVEGFGLSTEAMSAILKASPIFIIGAVLFALFNAFSKTTEGAKTLKVAGAALNAVFDTLTGIVGGVGNTIVEAFENPQESLKSFGDAILTNVLNRFKALQRLAKLAGQGISALVKGDFQQLKKVAKETGQGIIQLNTGLDPKQQKDFADSIKNTTKKIVEQANAAADLERQYQNLAKLERELGTEAAKLNAEYEIQSEIAADTTKSFADQEAALLKALAAREKAGAIEVKLSNEKLRLINEEVRIQREAGTVQSDLLDQQAEAQRTAIEAQKAFTLSVAQNTRERNQLEQDRIEKDLDVFIDGFDVQKTINEQQIANDRFTIEERKKILAETRTLQQKALDEQVKAVEKLAKQEIDITNLIGETDAVRLQEKIRNLQLSEIGETRLFEVIKEQQLAIQDLNVAEQDLNEASKKRSQSRLTAIREREKAEIEAALSVAKTDEEIFQLKKDLLDKETEIRREAIEAEITDEVEKKERLKQLEIETNLELAEIDTEAKEQQEERDNQANATKLQNFQAVTSQISSLLSQTSQVVAMQAENETRSVTKEATKQQEELKRQLDAGIITQEQFDAKSTQLKEQNEKEVEKIQKKAFERQKKLRIAETLITTANAAINAFNSLAGIPIVGPVLGAIAAASATALGLAQVNEIRKQEFAEGGLVTGPSHEQGGVPFTVQGRGGYEMEGGEYIIRKDSVNSKTLPILDSINKGRGDNTNLFRTGGITTAQSERQTEANINNAELTAELIQSTPIYVTVEDIRSETGKVVEVENQANL